MLEKIRKINIKAEVDKNEYPLRSIFIASYYPRKCGIANFTKDLTTAINNLNPLALAEIIAMDDKEQGDTPYNYPWEVKNRIQRNNPQSYIDAAHYINQSSADVVTLQHEFGLFGGTDGDYLLPMLDIINKPIVTCFHSILPEPDEHKKYIMKRIIEKSSAVIAMSELSRNLLIDVYDTKDESAVLIYHGVPDFTFNENAKYKKLLDVKADKMLLVSGLIGPGKGIEYVIEAMPAILSEYPKTVFYVVGETHPDLFKDGIDKYRNYLNELVVKHHLEESVKFVNEYVSLENLIQYYKACDIYLTPHLDAQQPTSGTLAYALGAGKICFSTPYIYAKEMLDKDVGILIPFKDSASIAEQTIRVFKDETLANKYRNNAYQLGKLMQWPRVAYKYLKLFKVINEHFNE